MVAPGMVRVKFSGLIFSLPWNSFERPFAVRAGHRTPETVLRQVRDQTDLPISRTGRQMNGIKQNPQL